MAEINERASVSIDCPLSPTGPAASGEVHSAAQEAFERTKEFVQGQLECSLEDYRALQDMNQVTTQRYQDMHQVAQNISGRLAQLNVKCECGRGWHTSLCLADEALRPYLAQVDEIDKCSKELEATVEVLEKYLNSLETRLKMAQLSSPA